NSHYLDGGRYHRFACRDELTKRWLPLVAPFTCHLVRGLVQPRLLDAPVLLCVPNLIAGASPHPVCPDGHLRSLCDNDTLPRSSSPVVLSSGRQGQHLVASARP